MRTSSRPAGFGRPARIGLGVALTALIAGCSAGSTSPATSPSATSATSATSASATSPTATASAATALSGPQLARVLLPASSMPKGYKTGSATRDTGSQLPSDTAQPMPASQVCRAFTQSSYIRAAGISTGDWAEGDYISADQSQEITEEVDIFTGNDARQAMATLWREFGQCSSFSYQTNGTTASNTLTRSRLAGVGDDAIKAVIVSPLFQGGETLMVIRVGSRVITTLDSATASDLGSSAVGYAEQIEQRLRAAG